jgi:hypothetical protein
LLGVVSRQLTSMNSKHSFDFLYVIDKTLKFVPINKTFLQVIEKTSLVFH